MMNIQKVRKIARNQGLSPGKRDKVELVKMIQRREGNFDCFATAYQGVCDQYGCIWREDCFEMARQGLAS